MKNPVGWFEIYVNDMARAKAFYEAVFSVTLTRLDSPAPDMEMWLFPMEQSTYGASGALVKMEGISVGQSGGGTLVYFHCADCAHEANQVLAHGGKVCKPKTAIGANGFIAIVYDSEGNLIGLHSMQ